MSSKILGLLNKLEKRIHLFTRDEGILDSEDHETKIEKAQNMLFLAQSIQEEKSDKLPGFDETIVLFKRIVELLALGEPEFESEQQIRTLLKKIRSYVKGAQLHLELGELDTDDDIPEHVYEAYEPWVDPDTGECEYPTDLAFHHQVLWAFKANQRNPSDSQEFTKAANDLSTQLQGLSLKLNDEYQVDLGDGLKGIADPRHALRAELEEMRKATAFYFEPTHLAKTAEVARLAQAFYQKQSVSTDLSAGSIIIAASEALRSVYLLKEPLTHHDAKLDWQGVPLCLQRKPSAKNLGNLFIRNVGCYGYREDGKKTKLNLLDDFHQVIAYSGESRLKSVIAKYGACPHQITCQMLKLPETTKGKELLKKLKQDLFLIFCAEIFRYFPVEEVPPNRVKHIPFAVALSIGLEMLYVGDVELEELFDHDAELGLPTGSRILDNPNEISKKLYLLLERYQSFLEESYQSVSHFKSAFPQGRVISCEEQHVERLQTYFGKHLK